MEILVAFQGYLEQLDLFLVLHSFAFCLQSALFVTLLLVEGRHLIDAFFVLQLYSELILELVEHAGYLCRGVGSIGFDEIYGKETLSIQKDTDRTVDT